MKKKPNDLDPLLRAKYAEGYLRAIIDLCHELRDVNQFALMSIEPAVRKVQLKAFAEETEARKGLAVLPEVWRRHRRQAAIGKILL
jgi:hypothetical protein